jgi:malonyl-CoA O-methyltransferase
MTSLRRAIRKLFPRSRLLRDGWLLIDTVRMTSRPGRSSIQTIKSLLAERAHPAPARALHWVHRNELTTGGIRVHSRHAAAYAEVTGYLIPTLLGCGETELAVRCTKWLISVQAADGSYADPNQGLPYIFDTGQVLRGLLATIDIVPRTAASARRAAEYLCRRAVDGGRAGFDVRYPDTDPKSTHLYVLPPLFQAATLFGEPRYAEIAERCLEHYCRRPDALRIETLTHFLAYEIEALIDLGRKDLAMPVLNQLGCLQRNDGSLRGEGGQEWVCTPGLAQIAVCWYKIGQRRPADKALAWIEAHQLWCGGFYGSYGPRASYFPDVVPAWAVKFYLDAHRLRLQNSLHDARLIESLPAGQD